jgi:hypothetical protein
MKAYTIAGVELPEYWDVLREAWEGRALGGRRGGRRCRGGGVGGGGRCGAGCRAWT